MNLAPYIEAAERAADAAREAIRPHFRAQTRADTKPDNSPVTRADRAAEAAIRASLAGAFPEHGRLGEEEGLESPNAALRWVFDPIDGTRAFLTGRPSFGTLIALMDGDTPILGMIDQPITGERWIGVRNEPTRFTGPLGGTIGTRRHVALDQAELSATAPEMFSESEHACFMGLAKHTRRTYWGGDCYAYGLLALGQIDIVCEAGLKIWDWAALAPIVAGAGGCITDWEGKRLTAASTQVLAAGNPRLVGGILEILKR